MSEHKQQPVDDTPLKPWLQVTSYLLACIALAARRPDAMFKAQFFAEDGHVWFADAHNLGWWPALFQAHTGYYQTLPRLASALALLVPLQRAPLVMNLLAIAIMALPVLVLLSPRSREWGPLRFRALLASVFVFLPNSREMSYGITESQWLLALTAFLLIVASPPQGKVGRVVDIVVLLLSGLTGPFCIFLTPMAIFLAWKRRDRWHGIQAGLLAALCLVQAWALLFVDPTGRTPNGGATWELGVRLLAGHVFLDAIFGSSNMALLPGSGFFVSLLCIAVGGCAMVAMCFTRGPLPMKLFLVFSGLILAASLKSPMVVPPTGMTPWMVLVETPGIRYWYFPVLAFAWCLFSCYRTGDKGLRNTAATLLVLMCIGVMRDWRHRPYDDMHYAENAKRFEAAPVGTTVTMPQNPEGWNMVLVKQ